MAASITRFHRSGDYDYHLGVIKDLPRTDSDAKNNQPKTNSALSIGKQRFFSDAIVYLYLTVEAAFV
jgi:hypothetical protein